jgi:superfamily I DNA/RNA helicase
MDKEYIKKLAEDPNFIPGIYNYCDRWCERCSFTSRCMNFALSEEQFDDPQARDINNEAFWQKLHEVFQVTLEMVKEFAEQEGIDLDSLDLQQAADEREAIRDIAENHECCRAAKAYVQMVKNWFDSAKDLFEQKADDLNLKARLELPDSNPAKEAAGIKDSVDIIRWYQHFIYVKLLRAIRGNLEETPPCLDEFPKDSDGSAKIALIAIDRSIAAWGQMRQHFPDREGDTLDILIHLDRLRRTVETIFPDARKFVRPGFDYADKHG